MAPPLLNDLPFRKLQDKTIKFRTISEADAKIQPPFESDRHSAKELEIMETRESIK